MRKIIVPAAAVFLGLLMLPQLTMAAGRLPTRKAITPPVTSAGACMKSQLVARAAYVPTAPEETGQCGHLLSTDTLLKVHHWAST